MEDKKNMPRRLRRLTNMNKANPCFFLTLCSAERKKCLAADCVHLAFIEFMQSSPERYGWSCGEYVLMPDHIHFFAAPFPDGVTMGAWIKAIKAFMRVAAKEKGINWQKGFFDHVLRSNESYAEKWEYVRQNPVRAGLVANPYDWPFLGQIDIHGI